MINQHDAFEQTEANLWYTRNKEAVEKSGVKLIDCPVEVEHMCATLKPFQSQILNVLEIGCSSGKKLEAICNFFGAAGSGLEPSILAVEDGNRRLQNTNIQLQCGMADKLPYASSAFDLILFGFSLYLFDRSSLLTALAEADRVLKSGGFLAITDFDPGVMNKRPYIHKDGIFSYKQDYSKFYTESGLYYLFSKFSFSHQKDFFDCDTNERVATTLLYKEVDPYPLYTTQHS